MFNVCSPPLDWPPLWLGGSATLSHPEETRAILTESGETHTLLAGHPPSSRESRKISGPSLDGQNLSEFVCWRLLGRGRNCSLLIGARSRRNSHSTRGSIASPRQSHKISRSSLDRRNLSELVCVGGFRLRPAGTASPQCTVHSLLVLLLL